MAERDSSLWSSALELDQHTPRPPTANVLYITMSDRYHTPAEGTENWDQPLNENFTNLDIDVEHRGTTDPDTAGVSPAAGAKFLDTSTGEIYTADGTSWTLQWDLGDIGSGTTPTTVTGIADTRRLVGPMYEGPYHLTNTGAGVMFWAAGGTSFDSCVIDADLSAVSHSTLPIALVHYDGGADHSVNPNFVDTIAVTVSGGPERIDISALAEIPSDGEYVLAHDTEQLPSGNDPIDLRRIDGANFGAAAFGEYTYDVIDFRKSTAIYESGDGGAADFYMYFFDIAINDPVTRVTSPWSTDVDEIYMRPRPPEEEFNNVSPRSIWFDTS